MLPTAEMLTTETRKQSPSPSRSRRQSSPLTSSAAIQIVLGVAFCALAILAYKKHWDDQLRDKLDGTLNAMLDVEKSLKINTDARIAIGYGSCIDVVVPAVDVLPSLPPSKLNKEQFAHPRIITNQEQLLESFAYFFTHGAAAERYIANRSLFNDLVSRSRTSINSKETLGGNAPVMATRFYKEGIRNILLGSIKTPDLMSYLSEGIVVPDEDDLLAIPDKEDKPTVVEPPLKSADVHLLLEYPSGQSWSSLKSPRANRFIVHSDESNPMIKSLESFHSLLSRFNPDLLIVSGLQMLDNFPYQRDEGRHRVDQLSSHLQDFRMSNPDTLIHFEMASFTEEQLLKQVISDILPTVDSVGMNEQELPNLQNIFAVGNITLLSNPYPRTAVVLDQMRDVFTHLDHLSSGQISRIHVHTLAFQAVLTKKSSPWKNTKAGATKSALTAHRHTCGDDIIDVDKAKLLMDDSFTTTNGGNRIRIQFDPQFPVPCWEESIGTPSSGLVIVEICVAPVLVCTKVLQTGGGGDNVSAAGLVAQL